MHKRKNTLGELGLGSLVSRSSTHLLSNWQKSHYEGDFDFLRAHYGIESLVKSQCQEPGRRRNQESVQRALG